MLSRRTFLARLFERGADATLLALLYEALTHSRGAAGAPFGVHVPPVEAEYYAKSLNNSVDCNLCPRHEHLDAGETGRCRVRMNDRGVLKTYACGQPCVLNIDPIEKNPACHFMPGSKALTIAHAGCNLHCMYCQNWEFSQKTSLETNNLSYNEEETLRLASQKGVIGVTFTYTEGTSHIEFNKKLAAAARRMRLRTYLCTNGYVLPQPLADFLEVLDGVTVTIKGFSNSFYGQYIGAADFKPVLESCNAIRKSGQWLELATLIVAGINDGAEELRGIARWIRDDLGPETPWHLERFAPKYMLSNRPQTPVKTLEQARAIGQRAGLKYVYISNVAPHEGNHTYCPRCGKSVIERLGFKVLENRLRGGRCPYCRTSIPGIWG
jgi:pyruvate formate lyase activating enzyme